MSWETPKLSRNDIELLTVALDDYIYNSSIDSSVDIGDIQKLLFRLDEHLQKT
jgi:hypothetical protein